VPWHPSPYGSRAIHRPPSGIDVAPRDRDPAGMHEPTTESTPGDLVADGPRSRRRRGMLGGLHYMAWVFILLALGDLVWYIVTATFDVQPTPVDVIVYAIQVVPAVVAILLPAALLARHPDATTRMPLLLLGTIFYALVQGLLILGGPLEPIFETITPATDGPLGVVTLAEVYNGLILLIASSGLAFIARGLSLARRYDDRPAPWISLIVPVATVIATVVAIVSASRLDLGDQPLPPTELVTLAVNVALEILRVAVWAYLLVTVIRGLRAGEDPDVGWRLAVLATSLILVALGLLNVGGVFDIAASSFGNAYGWLTVLAYALGHLGLLAAFAYGLPALDEIEAEADGLDDAAPYRGVPVFEDEFPEERRR
jgi:hypothetical protein